MILEDGVLMKHRNQEMADALTRDIDPGDVDHPNAVLGRLVIRLQNSLAWIYTRLDDLSDQIQRLEYRQQIIEDRVFSNPPFSPSGLDQERDD